MKNAIASASLALALLPIVACQSVNSVERAQPVGQRQMVDDKRVITDGSLGRRIRILGVNESETPAGYLKVQAELLNSTRSRRSIQYMWEWYDLDGNQISSASAGYRTRVIEGGESVFLGNTAPNDRAKDFRLNLLEADR